MTSVMKWICVPCRGLVTAWGQPFFWCSWAKTLDEFREWTNEWISELWMRKQKGKTRRMEIDLHQLLRKWGSAYDKQDRHKWTDSVGRSWGSEGSWQCQFPGNCRKTWGAAQAFLKLSDGDSRQAYLGLKRHSACSSEPHIWITQWTARYRLCP